MPLQRKNVRYSAVSSTVVIVAIAIIVTSSLRGLIPAPAENDLDAGDEGFLKAGLHQDIAWRNWVPATLSEARRMDKPIFLVIGSESSRLARDCDKYAFTDPEVAATIRRRFIPVRIDANEMPEWSTAYLPFRRMSLLIDSGFQIWVLDPASQLYFFPDRRLYEDLDQPTGMIALLRGALRDLVKIQNRDPKLLPAGIVQAQDLRALFGTTGDERIQSTPDLIGHYANLVTRADRAHGGFLIENRQFLKPFAWRFLIHVGDTALLRASLDPVLSSSVVDWLDGGFFRGSDTVNWDTIQFDKVAVDNAEMMSMLASANSLLSMRSYRAIAERTFDSLIDSFRPSGAFATYRVGDGDAGRRSARSSFPPRLLRTEFSLAEQTWLARNLGLDVNSNHQMVPRVTDLASFADDTDTYDSYVARLRKLKQDVQPAFGADRQLDTEATVVARLMETARILHDKDRLARLEGAFVRLSAYRVGSWDVFHSLRKGGSAHRYLGDYLSYADAAYEDFLAFNRPSSLSAGIQVLARGLELYQAGRSGVVYEGRWDQSDPHPHLAPSVSLLDQTSESGTAKLLRLLTRYSRALSVIQLDQPPAINAAALDHLAQAILDRYALAANTVQLGTSSFFSAAAENMQSGYLVVVGDRFTEDATKIADALPTVPTLMLGRLTPTEPWRGRAPGLYVVINDRAEGPLSPDVCVERLSSAMQIER